MLEYYKLAVDTTQGFMVNQRLSPNETIGKDAVSMALVK